MKLKLISLLLIITLVISLIPLITATPTEKVDQEQSNCADAYLGTDYGGKLVQSFKPTLNQLTKVKLYAFKNESPPNAIKISIRDSLYGEDLTSVIVEPEQLLVNISSWFEADFPNISVTPEDTYYLVWAPTPGDDNEPYFWWCYDIANPGDDPYERGSMIIGGEEIERADFSFKTYGYSIPTITISEPAAGAELGGVITIEGSADDTDGDIQRIEIKIDEGEWVTATGLSNWYYDWDTRTINNGAHIISARSYDGESFSKISTITVFIQNSMVTIEDISGGMGTVSATIHNSGNETINNVEWTIMLVGGFFNLIDVETTGNIASIPVSDENGINITESLFGFGRVTIEIRVQADNAYDQQREVNGFILGPYILIS